MRVKWQLWSDFSEGDTCYESAIIREYWHRLDHLHCFGQNLHDQSGAIDKKD